MGCDIIILWCCCAYYKQWTMHIKIATWINKGLMRRFTKHMKDKKNHFAFYTCDIQQKHEFTNWIRFAQSNITAILLIVEGANMLHSMGASLEKEPNLHSSYSYLAPSSPTKLNINIVYNIVKPKTWVGMVCKP